MMLVTEALALFRRLEDREGIIRATVISSFVTPDFEQAKSDLEQCLTPAADLSSEVLARVHFGMMRVAARAGDFQLAFIHGETSLNIHRKQGNRINQVGMMDTLGRTYVSSGNHERATTLFLESLILARSLNAKGVLSETLQTLGYSACLQEEYEQANVYFRDALANAQEIGGMTLSAYILSEMGACFMAQGALGQATVAFQESITILRDEHRVTDVLIWNFWMLAQLAEQSGELVRAGRLQGAAELLGPYTSHILTPEEVEDIERNIAYVRTQLGEKAYSVATAVGRAMSLDEAIAYALKEQA